MMKRQRSLTSGMGRSGLLSSLGVCVLFFSAVTHAQAFQFAVSPGTYPHGLTTDGTNLWHADLDSNRVYKLDSEGQVTSSYSFPHGNPHGLAYSAGVLFVATGSRVYRLTAESGAYLSDFSSPDLSSPNHQGLAFGDGKLWIASRGASDDRIYGVNPSTGVGIVDFAAPGSNPRGLTYYDGSLWNLDSSDDTLYRLSTANGSVQASYPIPLGNPRGLTHYNGKFLQADKEVDVIMGFGITNTFSEEYVAPYQYSSPGNSLWLPYISSHPPDQTNTSIHRILFFQHGVSDNAVEYFGRALHAAQQAGRLDETLVVTLQLLDDGKLQSAPPTNMIYWTSKRFWGGLSAGATAPYPRSERFSAFELLDDFLSELTTNASLFPKLEEIVISGHSGGGQFANRYAATSPFERTMLPQDRGLSMHYVVMNPSPYVYFDEKRFDPATLDLGAGVVDFIIPSSPSPGYNEYGYGLEVLNDYPASVGSNNIVAQYPSRKVIYLAGEADTGTVDLDTSPQAMSQGANRYERSLIYYEHLKDHFSTSNLPRHRLATVPGIGHDSFDMITSSNGLRYHFQGHMRITHLSLTGTSATISWTGGGGGGAPACCVSLKKVMTTCGLNVVDMIPVRRQNLQAKLQRLELAGQWLA